MKTLLNTAILAATMAFAGMVTPANAATSIRNDVQMAAAACQPFFSTTQARYSASGLNNAGTSQFYVVCSMGGFWQGETNMGNDYMGVVVYNPTGNSINVACTARPGYVIGGGSVQGASPQSSSIAAGSFKTFSWIPSDFGATTLKNANFTCTLPPGATINFVETYQYVDVGA